MLIQFQQNFKDCTSLEETLERVKTLILKFKQTSPNEPVVYVAGKVTTDGASKILSNLARLATYTEKLRGKYGFVFSSADIFNQGTYWRLNIAGPLHEKDFYFFWRKVVGSGVTDIYMTPDWKASTGASDEFNTAKKLGLKIHYFK
jgi:hypothetical protein